MTVHRAGQFATMAALGALVSGCGGDGGGSVASTPPPPPVAGTNTSLIGPLKSEAFVNDSAKATISYDSLTGGGGASGLASATFTYDAGNQSYTVAIDGKSLQFSPAEKSATQSNAQVSTYVATSGSTTNTLTLTNPGTSGAFNYQYVGGALLQSSAIGSGGAGTNALYATAYGEPTAASAVPKTGAATYAIDILGAATWNTAGISVQPFTGQGGVAIDFKTGGVTLAGAVTGFGGPVSLTGDGTLSASGTFSGNASLTGFYSGPMSGRLYGPSAQEIGGTFSTTNGGQIGADESVGVFVGRQAGSSTLTGNIHTLTGVGLTTESTARQYIGGGTSNALGSAAVTLSGGGDGNSQGTFLAAGAAAPTGFQLSVYPGFAGSNLSIANVLDSAGSTGPSLEVFNPSVSGRSYLTFDTIYTRAALDVVGTGSSEYLDYFVTGIHTAPAAMPTTGYYGYQTSLDGTYVPAGGTTKPTEVGGTMALFVDFSSGNVLLNGNLSGAGSISLTGSGTVSAANDSLTATFAGAGATTYSGSLQGSLFGPSANEVGGVFSASGSDSSNISGVFTGAGGTGSGLPDPFLTLAGQSAGATYRSIDAGFADVPGSGGTTPNSTIQSNYALVNYDPATQTYTISQDLVQAYQNYAVTPATLALSPANADAANSDATFAAYSDSTTTARVFKTGAGNPALALSYVSFIDVAKTGTNFLNSVLGPYTAHHFIIFGVPPSQVPTSGTANYNGVVYGYGTDAALAAGELKVGGTGQLQANFGTGAVSSTLQLDVSPVAGGASINAGSYRFDGTMTGSQFTAPLTAPATTGQMLGAFYGPGMAEVGAGFTISFPNSASPSGNDYLVGAFVGKKQ